jgi:CBS domain-containing protein
MTVGEAMSAVRVTVGTSHTLREAARRMTRGQVGSAEDGDIDIALVGEYVADNVVYGAADWPIERAAEAMTAGGFRHLIVLDGSEAVGILSMRDIVRSWVETSPPVQAAALAG